VSGDDFIAYSGRAYPAEIAALSLLLALLEKISNNSWFGLTVNLSKNFIKSSKKRRGQARMLTLRLTTN